MPTCLRGFDDAGGDDVALHDAAEDVDEDAFDFLVGEDDLERFGDPLDGGSAADVEEVGGIAAVVLDDVHGGHGEAGAVYQAADVAVERYVGEIVLGRFDLVVVFFVVVAHVADLGMPEQGVVVEAELGVQREQVAFAGDDEGVDLEHGAVAADEGVVQCRQRLARPCW